jgi:hypothetical protein
VLASYHYLYHYLYLNPHPHLSLLLLCCSTAPFLCSYHSVQHRNEERKAKAGNSRAVEKIGYVPRNKQAAAMNASGLTSAGMMGKRNEEPMDDDSAAGLARLNAKDVEIDKGIDAISSTIDNLTSIAGAMKDETLAQQAKLEKIDTNMTRTTEKQTVVNARQRYLLK